MFATLARFCVRRRRLVVFGIWIPLLLLFGMASRSVGGDFNLSFVLPNSEAKEAQELLEEINPNQAGFIGQVVFKSNDGFEDPALRQTIEDVTASIASLDGVDTTGPFELPGYISDSGTIAFAQIAVSDRSYNEVKDLALEIRAYGDAIADADLQVEYGGEMFMVFEIPESEAIGLMAAVIILVLAFGSVLAMGLPIGTALIGLGIGISVATIVSNVVAMPDFTTSMMAMIGLGVGIDYALFIVTRHHEGMHDGLSVEESIVEAIDTSGRAVLFAGVTVIISLLGLYIVGLQFISGLATGAAIGVFVMLIASLTLLPALLAMVGKRIETTTRAALISLSALIIGGFLAIIVKEVLPVLVGLIVAVATQGLSLVVHSLRRPLEMRKRKPHHETIWFRWSRYVQHRPWRALTGAVIVLVTFSIPLFNIRLGFSDTGNAPEELTVRRAYDLLAEGFGPGMNGPLLITAKGFDAATPEGIAPLVQTVADVPGIQFAYPMQLPPGGNVGVVLAYPETSPQDEATSDLVHNLRDNVLPASGYDALVGGRVASSIDFSDYIGNRLPMIIGAVLILSFLLLMVVFRSILVPLKAVVMNLLSIGAAYGVIVAIFQWGWGKDLIGVGRAGPIDAWVPMLLFAIVFGLSMDYEVFLLSRIKEEYDHTGNNAEAVANGLAATARVITAAALIMVSVFAAFVLGDDRQMKLFGLGMAVAVFIDATIVRMVLVPATMELLGNRNWWIPKWLNRVLPRIDVEGHSHTWDDDTSLVDNSK